MQLKRGFYYLPKIILGQLIVLLLIGAVVFSAVKVLYQGENGKKLTIAISMSEENYMEDMMFSILMEMESLKDTCIFVRKEKQEAIQMVQEGKAYAAFIVPQQFVEDIINGKNTPAEVYFNSGVSLESQFVQLLTQSGASALASAQAGIYTAVDFAKEQNQENVIHKILADLNSEYIHFALGREKLFDHITVQATGDLSVIQYYTAAGIVLFLLIGFLSFQVIFCNENKAMSSKLFIFGFSPQKLLLIQFLVSFFMAILSIFLLLIVSGFVLSFWQDFHVLYPFKAVLGILLAVFTACAYGNFIYAVSKTPLSAILLLFSSSIVLLFLSGGFIPFALLPTGIKTISAFLPTTSMIQSVSNGFTGDETGMIFCFVWGMVLIAAMLLTKIKETKRGAV